MAALRGARVAARSGTRELDRFVLVVPRMHALWAAVAAALISACVSDGVDGGVSVQIYNRDGVPLASWPVAFHGADGRLLDAGLTDVNGIARGPMEPDGMVTYRGPFIDGRLITRGQIQPGDFVINAAPSAPAELDSTLTVVTSNTPAAGRLVRLAVECGPRLVRANGVPGHLFTVNLPGTCAWDGTGERSIRIFATVTDERAEIVAYTTFDTHVIPPDSAPISVHRWNQDLVTLPVTFENLDADVVRYRLEVATVIGPESLTLFIEDGREPASSVTSHVAVPAGIEGHSSFRFEAQFATAELTIEQPLGLPPQELLPRITAIALRVNDDRDRLRPVVVYSTERPLDGDLVVTATLVAPASSWEVTRMRGPTVRLPELPASFAPFLVEDLEVFVVGVRVETPSPKGPITRTTGMPYHPWVRELPL
jgi:hypothetical protein